VLGAGPAGISAAAALASLRHRVSLFDRGAALGGQAQQTIPAERLPLDVLHREIHDVLASSGVDEHREYVRIDKAYNLEHVFGEGFDAVLIALGLSKSVPLPGSPRPASGVEGALEFLERTKNGETLEGSVLVLGGGNTAIDAALSAQRAGASDVSIVYRRSFAEMPAWPEERDAAIRAGINFLILTAPLAYITDAAGNLAGLKVVRTALGKPDASGRRRPENIPGSEHVLPVRFVIEALGQQIDSELAEALPGVCITARGLLWTREGALETSRRGVFAAGDLVNGGTTVVQAVTEGARAAREIDQFLRLN
jgi:NADPH-dependent glutamate synthase beta subunit-like oxidoreductase